MHRGVATGPLLPDNIPEIAADLLSVGGHCGSSIGGATPKFWGGPNLRLYDRRYTSDLWPITHNSGIGDRHNLV